MAYLALGYLALAARAALLLVFLVSAVSKLRGRRHFRGFADSLRSVAPPRLTQVTAAAVAAAEATCVLLLALPATARYGFMLAAALLAAFTLVAGWAVGTGRQLSCRCFGRQARPFGPPHLLRNVLLLALAGCGLGAGPVPVAGGLVAVAAGGTVALILISLDDVIELWHPSG
jgi:uncharacterized membrane protein YphA (DoxX/SURF4 family)